VVYKYEGSHPVLFSQFATQHNKRSDKFLTLTFNSQHKQNHLTNPTLTRGNIPKTTKMSQDRWGQDPNDPNRWYPTDEHGNLVYNSQHQGYGRIDYETPIWLGPNRGRRGGEAVYDFSNGRIGEEVLVCEWCGHRSKNKHERSNHRRGCPLKPY
jgi:hypothetical protein